MRVRVRVGVRACIELTESKKKMRGKRSTAWSICCKVLLRLVEEPAAIEHGK
jgi:hypothetical protein